MNSKEKEESLPFVAIDFEKYESNKKIKRKSTRISSIKSIKRFQKKDNNQISLRRKRRKNLSVAFSTSNNLTRQFTRDEILNVNILYFFLKFIRTLMLKKN